MRRTQMCWS